MDIFSIIAEGLSIVDIVAIMNIVGAFCGVVWNADAAGESCMKPKIVTESMTESFIVCVCRRVRRAPENAASFSKFCFPLVY